MNREEVNNLLPILQAFVEGKILQKKDFYANGTFKWIDVKDEIDEFGLENYRIKPEPKYRPFKNSEECWNEMLKHQPFGWVKDKEDGHYSLITCVDDKVCLNANNGWSMNGTMDNFTFADGSVFGVKEEE